MKMKNRLIPLFFAKYLGIFYLSRLLTARGLRILCYHGFSAGEDHRFHPRLFMCPEMFAERMNILRRTGFPVLPLDAAIEKWMQGNLPKNAVVITIDDGWVGTYFHAMPVLREMEFPATVYVTTYYVIKGQPVLNILFEYIPWKSAAKSFDLSTLEEDRLEGVYSLDDPSQRLDLAYTLHAHSAERLTSEERLDFVMKVARHLDVDLSNVLKSGAFQLMTAEQIKKLKEADIDVQLHTHRHQFPADDQTTATEEIAENRDVLQGMTENPLQHFCYPSGRYAHHQFEWLQGMGVKSATTTRPGLNYQGASRYELARICDSETLHPLEFEAELCGFTDCFRRIRSYFFSGA